MRIRISLLIIIFIYIFAPSALAQTTTSIDTDNDGLNDELETRVYHTNPQNPDTDNDGYNDGEEVKYLYDPNKSFDDKLQKSIKVNLANQELAYYLGPYLIKNFKISSGRKPGSTPKGEFEILVKKPFVTYKGSNYYYPNTRWNMMFKKTSWGNLYIHGAYWHNKFGQPVSRGCVNVPYSEMEEFYNWTDVGTKVTIE